MSTETPTPREPPERTPILFARMSTAGFAESWNHCEQIANYVARFAASDRFDTERYTTLLSTFLNELLETVFRLHADRRDLTVSVYRVGDDLDLTLRIPVDAAVERAYRSAFTQLDAEEPREAYRARFSALIDDPKQSAALLELVGVYNTRLSLTDPGEEGTLELTMPVTLSDPAEAR